MPGRLGYHGYPIIVRLGGSVASPWSVASRLLIVMHYLGLPIRKFFFFWSLYVFSPQGGARGYETDPSRAFKGLGLRRTNTLHKRPAFRTYENPDYWPLTLKETIRKLQNLTRTTTHFYETTYICSGLVAGSIPTMPPAGNLFNYSSV